jgi:hypothetical protein
MPGEGIKINEDIEIGRTEQVAKDPWRAENDPLEPTRPL